VGTSATKCQFILHQTRARRQHARQAGDVKGPTSPGILANFSPKFWLSILQMRWQKTCAKVFWDNIQPDRRCVCVTLCVVYKLTDLRSWFWPGKLFISHVSTQNKGRRRNFVLARTTSCLQRRCLTQIVQNKLWLVWLSQSPSDGNCFGAGQSSLLYSPEEIKKPLCIQYLIWGWE